MKTLDDFIGNEVDEIIFYSNWYTSFYNACIENNIDPEKLTNGRKWVKKKKS